MSGATAHDADRVAAARNVLLGLHRTLGDGCTADQQLELTMGLLSGVAVLLSRQLGAPAARSVLVGVAAQLVPLDAAARMVEHVEQSVPADPRKPCTCDGAGRGPGRACVVKAGRRLGELWRCVDAHEPAQSLSAQ